MAFALLSLPSAMIPAAIIPGLPTIDPALGSSPDGPIQSQENPLADFGSLLLLLAAQPASGQSVGDEAAPSETENVSAAAESAPPSLEMMAPLILLNTPAPQIPPNEKSAGHEFSPALDHSQAYCLMKDTELSDPSAVNPGLEASGDASGFLSQMADFAPGEPREEGSALPQLPIAAQENGKGIPSFRLAAELPAAPAAASDDKLQRGTGKAENYTPVALPEAALVRGHHRAEINSGEQGNEQKKDRPEDQGRQLPSAASSRAGADKTHDPESFVPPGLSIADGQVAAHVEGASMLPGERSGFFARDDNRAGAGGGNETIEASSQAALVSRGTPFHGVESERPAAAQPANAWSSAIERLAAEISSHVRQNRHEVTMRLEPPELGNLRIELSLDGDRLQARVTAELAETGSLIQTHLSELRQALQAHHLDLVNVQVDLAGWQGLAGDLAQQSHQESDGRQNSASVVPALQGSEGEQKDDGATASLSRGAVSVWA